MTLHSKEGSPGCRIASSKKMKIVKLANTTARETIIEEKPNKNTLISLLRIKVEDEI